MSIRTDDNVGEVGWCTVGSKGKKGCSTSNSQPVVFKKREPLSTLRLAKEFKHLAANPIDGIAAAPLDDNLMEWHATISVAAGVLEGGLFHFKLRFPKTYPGAPPKVIPAVGIPHINCERKGQGWQICSDLLQTQGWENEEGKQYKGWSSAYNVESILLQLQLLLLEAKKGMSHMTAAKAKNLARRYVCAGCGHTHGNLKPELVGVRGTEEESKIVVLPTRPQVVKSDNIIDKLKILGTDERVSLGWKTLKPLKTRGPGNMVYDALEDEDEPIFELLPDGRFRKGTPIRSPIPVPEGQGVQKYDGKEFGSALFEGEILEDKGTDDMVLVRFTDRNLGFLDLSLKLDVILKRKSPWEDKAARRARVPRELVEIWQPTHLTKKPQKAVEACPAKKPQKAVEEKEVKVIQEVIQLVPSGERLKKGTQLQCPFPLNNAGSNTQCQLVEGRVYTQRDFAAHVVEDTGSDKVLVQFTDNGLDFVVNLSNDPWANKDTKRALLPRQLLKLMRSAPIPVKEGQLLALQQKVWSKAPFKGSSDGFTRGHFKARILKDNGSAMVLVQFCDPRITEKAIPFMRAIVPRTNLMLPSKLPKGLNYVKTVKTVEVKAVEATPAASTAASDSTSEAPSASPSALQVDPFMMAKDGISNGDTVILKSGRKGQVADVGTGHIFGVMFEGAEKMEMVSRGLVAFWKQAQGIQIETLKSKKSRGKCRILELGVTSLFSIFEFLSVRELARSACVCKQFKRYSEDGFLWRTVFVRRFPKTSLNPGSLSTWKHVFALETEQIFDQLICFQTKASFSETTLGIPIMYTVNPKKNIIDYMFSTCDLLSVEAYNAYKVRKTKWQEEFTHWLPIYISYDHFKRSQPVLEKALIKLAQVSNPQRWHSGRKCQFCPTMALEVLPKLMKTFTVLIADKGIDNLEGALLGYFTIHRLFIALCLEYPELRREIDDRIKQFLRSEHCRSKEGCPDLGEFQCLLSVSDTYSWDKVVGKIALESLDRQVLWICRTFPELHWEDKVPDRLAKTYQCTAVSRRIAMFQGYFARTFKGKRTIFELANYYDRYYGRPSRADVKEFKSDIEQLLASSSEKDYKKGYPAYFKAIGFRMPSWGGLEHMLEQAVVNSKDRGYTRDGMRFDKIHRSGVSKILMRGESYSINPSARTINVEDLWTCPGSFDYLDASVILLKEDGEYITHADYCSRRVMGEGDHESGPAVKHSGDMIHGKNGSHRIEIDLTKLPADVHRLVFTVSAWRGTFKNIAEPYIRLCDENKSELCRHSVAHLVKKHPDKTLAIFGEMCRTKGKAAKWEFNAHSLIGTGNVRDYGEIIGQIPGAKVPKVFSRRRHYGYDF